VGDQIANALIVDCAAPGGQTVGSSHEYLLEKWFRDHRITDIVTRQCLARSSPRGTLAERH
jgi:hypothetical protein